MKETLIWPDCPDCKVPMYDGQCQSCGRLAPPPSKWDPVKGISLVRKVKTSSFEKRLNKARNKVFELVEELEALRTLSVQLGDPWPEHKGVKLAMLKSAYDSQVVVEDLLRTILEIE